MPGGLEEILTPERKEALEKFLDTLVKLNNMGFLDAVRDILDPELVGRLSEILLRPSTLQLIDRLDDILDALGKIDPDSLINSASLLGDVLKAMEKEPKPVGIMGLPAAMSDPDVKRGLGVAIEILKVLGKAQKK